MKIYIAPMAGITDYSFRKILEKFSPDFLFTEMVNSHLLATHDKTTETELLKYDSLKNTGTQVFGSDEEEIVYSFQKLEEMGFKKINLNMGCPQPKIIKNGSGSALLLNKVFIENLICKLKKHLSSDTEISIKIRTGYKNFSEPEFYLNLANKYQLDFICVHGRTQEQIYGGTADWDIIRKLGTLPRNVDFIGNGDLFEPHDIVQKINNSNLDGIMLARGIIGNPWLISQIKELMKFGKIFTIPKFSEVKSTLLEHLELLSENKGAIIASMEINKFIKPYFKSFQSEELHEKLNKIIIEKNLKHKIDLISLL
jgi:nitrogen regulation protein nifr3